MKFFPRIFTIVIVLSLLLGAHANAAPQYLFKIGLSLPLPEDDPNQIFAGTADISGDGSQEWVFSSDRVVKFYHQLSSGAFELWQDYTLEAKVSAVHLSDLDGDGVSEVIVSYDDIGILDVIGWSEGQFWKSYSRAYLWTKVKALDSLSLSEFPFKVIMALGIDNSITLFRWNGVNPELLWTATNLKGVKLQYVGSGDFDLDGDTDFALAVNGAELQIYSPALAQLKPLWTNFPWGGISSSNVLDLDGDGASELVIASPAGLLYAFEWQNGYYRQKWQYEGVQGIPEDLAHLTLPLSGRQALVAEIRGKVVIWPLSTKGNPLYRSEVSANYPNWRFSEYAREQFLGWGSNGKTFRLVEYPSQNISAYYHRDAVNFTKLETIVSEGILWIPLRQLAAIFGLSIDYNTISDLVYLHTERLFMIFDPARQTVWVNSIPSKVTGGLKKINGIMSLSLPLAESMFNFSSHWLQETVYLFRNQ